jgi:hypothetical protein
VQVVVKKSEAHKGAILKALQAHFLFADLAPSSLRDLVDVMKPRTHAPGDNVIKQGVCVFFLFERLGFEAFGGGAA